MLLYILLLSNRQVNIIYLWCLMAEQPIQVYQTQLQSEATSGLTPVLPYVTIKLSQIVKLGAGSFYTESILC